MSQHTPGPIAKRWNELDSNRQQSLMRARDAAMHTDPTVLPPKDQNPDSDMPTTYQSIGGRGSVSLEGRMLLGIFPLGVPWLVMEPAPEVIYGGADPEKILQLQEQLFIRAVMIQSLYMQGGDSDGRDPMGFLTSMRQVIGSLLITGSSCFKVNDDFDTTVFRRDQYVVQRDQRGRLLELIIREMIHPGSLSPEQRQMCELNDPNEDDESDTEELYTRVLWDHAAKNWKIRQECCGQKIAESTEAVCPYVVPYYKLPIGEHEGRGYFELVALGDLRSAAELHERMLDFAAQASKMHPILDPLSSLTPRDLQQRSGTVLRDSVRGGVADKIGTFQTQKGQDFGIVREVLASLRAELSAAFMLQAGQVRQSERTTAYEVAETVIKDNEGTFGGFYASVADQLQNPLVRIGMHLLTKKKYATPVPSSLYRVGTLTGLAALARFRQSQTILDTVQVAGALGPEVLKRIDMGVVFDTVLRYRGVSIPGMVKSREQMQAEQNSEMQTRVAESTANSVVDAAATIATQQAGAPPA